MAIFGRKRADLAPDLERRLPPGQYVDQSWPVLSYGPTPRFDPATWDFRLGGEVVRERRFGWEEFLALPRTTVHADFHCVTRFSTFDNDWEGVATSELVKQVELKPSARFVTVWAEYGYTANLPLEVFLDDDCLFALNRNGQPLTPDHGYPVRLIVPKRYAWKGPKWARGVEFTATDRRGFWEERGYHNNAEPFAEERYSYQEQQ